MKSIYITLVVALFFAGSAGGATLYEQSIAAVLANGFSSPNVSYLLLEPATGRVISARWPDSIQAIPVGSLVKPFAALAYAQGHDFQFPDFICKGAAGGCWFPRGHGRLGIVRALAFSCNAYFRMLTAALRPEDVSAVMARYGLQGATDGVRPASLMGLGNTWNFLPQEIARAYCRLTEDSLAPGVWEVLQGLALAAKIGTASGVGRAIPRADALAKTGTAPCVHRKGGAGDGYVILIYPAESPQIALLVRVHGAPGSEAANLASQMLRVVVETQ